MQHFYAYVYRDPRTGEPFYVGKGRGSRAYKHVRGHSRHNRHLARKIAKLAAEGVTPEIEIFPCPDEDTALALEEGLIALYGRRDLGKGPLVNFTDGGEGSSGFRHSPEALEKMAAAKRGRTLPAEHRANLSKAQKARAPRSPETRARMSEAQKRRDPDHNAKIKASLSRPETRAKLSAAHKGRPRSPEIIAKLHAGRDRAHAARRAAKEAAP